MSRAGEILDWLRAHGSLAHRASLARYNIPDRNMLGVPMGVMKKQAKAWGRDHETALALWPVGIYEARIVAAHMADPARTDGALMDAWTADFDNWAICDTCCFTLFSKAPERWEKVPAYAARNEEFVKRTAFALIWAMSTHDKPAKDEAFLATFPLIEEGARDARPLVSKAVDMALRATGKRNAALHAAALALSEKLAKSGDRLQAKIGRKCLKELSSEKVAARLERKAG
ncbi:MAG: DNA alkylation repair protein [Pseudomonadota bacterium]